MKARRTPWWYYLVALIIGLAGGVGLAMLDERMATSLLGAPWFVDVVLMAMGIAVLALALQVHAYANTDPAKRPHAFINPQRAMITLVLAKALGLAGAALAGWYGGQALMCLTHLEASYYYDAAVECAIALVICIIDMVIGIVSEGLCQLPPDEGAENPKLKRAERRRRLQQAAAKTAK